MITIVLGPVRSGKSARASELANASGKRVILAVTAALDPSDAEMMARVERHRRDRPSEWTVVETARQTALPAVIREAPADTCVLVDALGTWIAALLLGCEGLDGEGGDSAAAVARATELVDAQGTDLADALASARGDVIIVAEETGWGLVPPSALGRVFRDGLGRLTQRLASRADRVELVVAGYAVDLRRIGTPVSGSVE
jgi:adenosylcobinamide kinase/adenosylcobinamide-phosphate guanylyltransferase